MRLIVLRIAKLLVFAVTVPVVLFLVQCTRDGEQRADLGKRWCEGVVAIFETDRNAFLTKHAKQTHLGLLVVRPTAEFSPATAEFVVKQSGEFVCRYWYDGVIFPQGRIFTSERRRWVPIN